MEDKSSNDVSTPVGGSKANSAWAAGRKTKKKYRKSEMAMDGMMSTSSGLSYHNAGDFYPRKFGPKPDVVPSGVTERKVGPLDKPDMVSVDVININDSGLFC